MRTKEITLWEELDTEGTFYQLLMPDTEYDKLIDSLVHDFPKDLQFDKLEKEVCKRLTKFKPAELKVEKLERVGKSYLLWFLNDYKYYLSLEEFFTKGVFSFHSREVLEPSSMGLKSLGMIYVGVNERLIFEKFLEEVYDEYQFSIGTG